MSIVSQDLATPLDCTMPFCFHLSESWSAVLWASKKHLEESCEVCLQFQKIRGVTDWTVNLSGHDAAVNNATMTIKRITGLGEDEDIVQQLSSRGTHTVHMETLDLTDEMMDAIFSGGREMEVTHCVSIWCGQYQKSAWNVSWSCISVALFNEL